MGTRGHSLLFWRHPFNLRPQGPAPPCPALLTAEVDSPGGGPLFHPGCCRTGRGGWDQGWAFGGTMGPEAQVSPWSPPSCSLELLQGQLGFQSWEGPKEAQGQPLLLGQESSSGASLTCEMGSRHPLPDLTGIVGDEVSALLSVQHNQHPYLPAALPPSCCLPSTFRTTFPHLRPGSGGVRAASFHPHCHWHIAWH